MKNEYKELEDLFNDFNGNDSDDNKLNKNKVKTSGNSNNYFNLN